MNLNHVKFALAVLSGGSFTSAARICNVTQPTLSNGIKQLEGELGGKLFERTTRIVRVTAFGHHMKSALQAIVSSELELIGCADEFANPHYKLVGIGFSPLVDMRVLNILTRGFIDQNPDVHVVFKECQIGNLLQLVRDEMLVIAIQPSTNRANSQDKYQFHSFPFYSEPLYYLSNQEAQQIQTPVLLRELANRTMVLPPNICGHAQTVRDLFSDMNIPLEEYVGQACSYMAMQDWANLGIAATILPWSKINMENRHRARPIHLKDQVPAEVHLEFVWKFGNGQRRHENELLEYIQKTAKKIVEGLHKSNEKIATKASFKPELSST